MTGRFSEISGRCPPPGIAGFGVSSGRQQLADDLRPSQPDGEMQGPSAGPSGGYIGRSSSGRAELAAAPAAQLLTVLARG